MKRGGINAFCAGITAVFAAVFFCIALGTLFTTVRYPEEYTIQLKPSRMILCCLVWIALFFCVWLLFRKFQSWMQKREALLAAVILLVCGALCAWAGFALRVTPLYDAQALFEGAKILAQTGSLGEYTTYFYIRPNNIAATVLYAGLFRVFGVAAASAAWIVCNVLCIVLSLWFAYLVAKQLLQAPYALWVLVLGAACLPLYCYAAVYYTDILAMPFVPAGILLYCRAMQTQGKQRVFLLCATGIVLGIGTAVKLTVVIVWIAIFLHCVLCYGKKRVLYFCAAAGMCLLLCVGAGGVAKAQLLPDANLRQNMALPFTHWPMMGLAGDGRWNNADEVYTASFATRQERIAADTQKIGERIAAYGVGGMLELFAKKSMYTFGDGTFNAASMLDDGALSPSPLHGIILYQAPHFVLYFYITTSFYLCLLFCMAAAAIRDLLLKRVQPNLAFLLRLSFFGLWAFLMMWESNSRYIVHFLPVLFLCAAMAVPALKSNESQKSIATKK